MTTTTTTNRGWLLRQAKAGKLWLKCCYHLTDDYAADAANKCGKMDHFKQVYVREPLVTAIEDQINALYRDAHPKMPDPAILDPMTNELSRQRDKHSTAQRDKAEGKIILWKTDFKTKSGHAYGDKKAGTFAVHSNLNYDYEVR